MRSRPFLTILSIAGLLVLAAAAVLYALPRADHPSGVQPEPATAPVLDTAGIDGAALYARLCDKCHGLNGTTYGPALTSLSSTSDEALTMLIRKGVPETDMHPLDEDLTPQQLAALVAYLKAAVLPKSAADRQKLAIGPNAAATQVQLALVPVEGSDLVARATLRDDGGAPMAGAKVLFNQVSYLGGRLPLAEVETNKQGLAIYYYPLKAGESVRIEAAYEGEPGRRASAASDTVSLPGGKPPASLATGLLSPAPPFGLVLIIGILLGSVWLTYAYVVSLLLQIASEKPDAVAKWRKEGSAYRAK